MTSKPLDNEMALYMMYEHAHMPIASSTSLKVCLIKTLLSAASSRMHHARTTVTSVFTFQYHKSVRDKSMAAKM